MRAVELAGVSCPRKVGGVLNIDLTVEAGEHITLFGPPASGKSTILGLLSGSLAPESGRVLVLGRPPRPSSKLIGYAAASRPLRGHLTPRGVLSRQLVDARIPAAQRPARMAEALEICGLYEARDAPVRELSGLQRNCLAIAQSIVHRPPVVLLDNLTVSFPPIRAALIHTHLDRLRAEAGSTIIYATTDSAEAERADRVLLLDAGNALAYDSPARLLAQCARETVTIEATDPAAVQTTLRGVFDIEMEEVDGGLRLTAADGLELASHLFRHSAGEARVVFVQRPTLWDVLEASRRPSRGGL